MISYVGSPPCPTMDRGRWTLTVDVAGERITFCGPLGGSLEQFFVGVRKDWSVWRCLDGIDPEPFLIDPARLLR